MRETLTKLLIFMILLLLIFTKEVTAQTVASEALSIPCFKGNQTAKVRLEKSDNNCKIELTEKQTTKTIFEDKQFSENCESKFQSELKRLKKIGYNCE